MEHSPNFVLCHRIIEHIRFVGVRFDAADLEADLLGVVREYGWRVHLTHAEQMIVFDDLYSFALSHESAEIAFTYHGEDILEVAER